jgi:hypothetical protein
LNQVGSRANRRYARRSRADVVYEWILRPTSLLPAGLAFILHSTHGPHVDRQR